MWYVAYLIFAQKPENKRRRFMCESCQVLFRASSALECYDRALTWAKHHEQEGAFRLVGVEHILSLDDEQPGDGSEIGGRFYEAFDVWKRVESLIPKKEEIPSIILEGHPHTPFGELMTPKAKRDLRVIFNDAKKKPNQAS
jgi:hypothetical protein